MEKEQTTVHFLIVSFGWVIQTEKEQCSVVMCNRLSVWSNVHECLRWTPHSDIQDRNLSCNSNPNCPDSTTINLFGFYQFTWWNQIRLKGLHIVTMKTYLKSSSWQRQQGRCGQIKEKNTSSWFLQIIHWIIKYPFIQVHFSHSYIEYNLIYKNVSTWHWTFGHFGQNI